MAAHHRIISDRAGGLTRRAFLGAGLILTRTASSLAQTMDKIPWDLIKQSAESIVSTETPSGTFPFELPTRRALLESNKKVFFHYFPPFPLSFHNNPGASDHYATDYLKRTGEGGKFASVGGYLRERPLPVTPWTNPYWKQINFAIEILRARLTGADGFAVDILRLPDDRLAWIGERMLFETASATTSDFWLVPEPDCVALRFTTADGLHAALVNLASLPGTYRLPDGRLLITPFRAESFPPEFWRHLMVEMASSGVPIAFLPVFLDPRSNAARYADISYGMSFWGYREVRDLTDGAQDTITRKLSKLNKILMQPIAPQDVRPKVSHYWETQNTRFFRASWENAIAENARYVQVITWNDYSESTELSPSSATQFLFYDLATYYIAWFKMGIAPRITKDAIYYCHRRQIVTQDEVVSIGDVPMHNIGSGPTTNAIELVAFLTAAAALQIEIAGSVEERQASAGLVSFEIPARFGVPVFRIVRNGKIIAEVESAWEIEANPDKADPLYVGGSSTRPVCYAAGCPR